MIRHRVDRRPAHMRRQPPREMIDGRTGDHPVAGDRDDQGRDGKTAQRGLVIGAVAAEPVPPGPGLVAPVAHQRARLAAAEAEAVPRPVAQRTGDGADEADPGGAAGPDQPAAVCGRRARTGGEGDDRVRAYRAGGPRQQRELTAQAVAHQHDPVRGGDRRIGEDRGQILAQQMCVAERIAAQVGDGTAGHAAQLDPDDVPPPGCPGLEQRPVVGHRNPQRGQEHHRGGSSRSAVLLDGQGQAVRRGDRVHARFHRPILPRRAHGKRPGTRGGGLPALLVIGYRAGRALSAVPAGLR